MSNPVIIFGAGASRSLKDIQPAHQANPTYYPPLTNELFEPRFSPIIEEFDLIKEELNRIEYAVRKSNNLENYLSRLSRSNDEISRRQLIEIQLYIHKLLETINNIYFKPTFKSTSHYYPFLRDLRKYHKKATIVTFNYDLFLDEAMEAVLNYKYTDINSYHSGKDYELFKVHGSINWYYLFNNHFGERVSDIKNTVTFISNALRGPGKLTPFKVLDRSRSSELFTYPALAVPTLSNKGFIVEEHQNLLADRIKNTKKIIIIGWSANDEYFTKEILENVNFDETQLIVISPNSAKTIIERLTPKEVNKGVRVPAKKWKIKPIGVNNTFSHITNDLDLLDQILNY